jgi:hypothetical protein
MALALALALTACTERGTERGHVEVVAYDKLGGGPAAGALVVFTDLDGSSRTAEVESDGRASGEVEAGGSVWLFVDRPPDVSPGPYITAYTDVQPGDTLEFGPPPEEAHAARGTMEIVGMPPAGTDSIRFTSNCPGPPTGRQAIAFDDRCETTADVVIYAHDVVGGTSGTVLRSYIWLPAQPIIDGGTITIDPGAWKTPELVTINFLNSGGPSDYFLTTTLRTIGIQGKYVPLVGSLLASGQAKGSDFITVFPPTSANIEIDLDGVLSPSVMAELAENGDVQWSIADDANGALVAHAMTAEYSWQQPIANYQLAMELRITSPAAAGGRITTPRLPGPLSKYQPREDFLINKRGFLFRFEGFDPALARRFAESGSPNSPEFRFHHLATMPTWSVASTLIFGVR